MDLSTFAETAGTVLAFVALYAIIVLAAKWMNDLLSPYNLSAEMFKKNNAALGISAAGYFLATSFVFIGAILGPSQGFVADLGSAAGYSALGIAFLNAARIVLDKLVLSRLSIADEIIERGNCGVGAVRAGAYIATGLIAAASVAGQGGGVITSIVFFVLGQFCLIAFARIYDWLTPFDLHAELTAGNTAAGVAFGGTLVAIAIIVADAVAGDFVGWREGLAAFATGAAIGMVLLPVVRLLMDKVIIAGHDLNREIAEDKNLAAGLVEMAVAVSFAAVIAALI